MGCKSDAQAAAAKAAPKAWSVTSIQNWDWSRAIYLVKHNATGSCFVVVESPNGVAMSAVPTGVCE